MPVDLIATFIVGAAAALFTWVFFRLCRRRTPRLLLPLAAGGAMLGYAVWSEYTWWWRTEDALPAGIEVIDTIPESSKWKPWTYLFPRVQKMVAVDVAGMRRNDRHPGVVLIDVVLLERLMPARRTIRLVDCPNARSIDVSDPSVLAEASLPGEDAWSSLRRDGGLYQKVCSK